MSCVGSQPILMRGKGAQRSLSPEKELLVIQDYNKVEGRKPVEQIAKDHGICKKTLYNILARHRETMSDPQIEKPPTSDKATGG